MIELKAITLKGDAMPNIEAIVALEIQKAAKEAKAEYEKTVRTWNKKPRFEILSDGTDALVGTDDEIYGYLDKGTKKKYPIPKQPKVVGALRFQEGYTSKTVPRSIGSRAGGPKGPVRFAKQVIHPGIEAREFSRLVQKTIQGRLTRRINTAIQRALRDNARKVQQ